MIVQVSVSLNIFDSLSYRITGDEEKIRKGTRVIVPVGNRPTAGWVMETGSGQSKYKGRVKNVLAVVEDEFVPSARFMDFVQRVSGSYFTSAGSLLDGALPPGRKPQTSLYFHDRDKDGKPVKLSSLALTDFTKKIKQLGTPVPCFYKSAAKPGPGDTGETGGGKAANLTDVCYEEKLITGGPPEREDEYAAVIRECTGRGQTVIIAVPDNLTASYIKDRLDRMELDCEIAVYNSDIKPKDRDRLWRDFVIQKKPGVVIGGQTALLMPVPFLGAVICERAGSPLYRRTFYSPYNVAVLARMRAQAEGVPFIEGFSSYTLNASRPGAGVTVTDRRDEPPNADVLIIKRNTRGIPPELELVMNRRVSGNESGSKKILVVLNKKENEFFLFCPECKTIRRCTSCNGQLDVDEEFNTSCRRCKEQEKTFRSCPKCGEPFSLVENISVASVKKLVKERISETGIATISSEGIKQEHLLSAIKRVKASNIVISTPVIVSPFFSRMFDAVIYLRPESFFNIDDHNAAEKVFSMVAELKDLVKPGGSLEVFSTFHFHYSLKLVNDEQKFFQRELSYREWFHLPPFANVYHIEIKAKDLRGLAKEMRGIYSQWKEQISIKRLYLQGRKPLRGVFKGTMEVHALPDAVLATGLIQRRDVSVTLEMAR